jgi:hypothetical protein
MEPGGAIGCGFWYFLEEGPMFHNGDIGQAVFGLNFVMPFQSRDEVLVPLPTASGPCSFLQGLGVVLGLVYHRLL